MGCAAVGLDFADERFADVRLLQRREQFEANRRALVEWRSESAGSGNRHEGGQAGSVPCCLSLGKLPDMYSREHVLEVIAPIILRQLDACSAILESHPIDTLPLHGGFEMFVNGVSGLDGSQ